MLNIIIPIYKTSFDEFEIISLKSIFDNFLNYNITFICPDNLELNFLDKYDFIKQYRVERFKDDYFKNIDGYNKLLVANEFYKRFEDFKYILICQTDVYIFKNELENWISKNYDYVGAPWIASKRNFINIFFETTNNLYRKTTGKKLKNTERIFKVGNGGFSLRKIEKFIKIIDLEIKNIEKFETDRFNNDYYIEDVFWSLYVPKFYSDFKIPDWKEALSFCIDRKPKLAFKLNNNKIPMACHGFNKPKVTKFWKKFILNLNK